MISMKKYSFILFCLITLTATAQEKLVIMGKVPNQYVLHTVLAGETLQSISNVYGQSVARLTSFNGRPATAILGIGVKLKIPVTEYNLLKVKGTENNAPVFHIVKKGDNLYRISKEYKVPLSRLKEWNKLHTELVKNGQSIIVGYMVNARNLAAKKNEPEVNSDKDIIAIERNVSQPAPTHTQTAPKSQEEKKPELLVPNPVIVKEPEQKVDVSVNHTYQPKDNDEGFFALGYATHDKDKKMQFRSGDGATFKTISGWTDHKYYVLINDIAAETIVRVTGPNNKSICAKVLGPLQETKGGEGLLLRISNSAASVLGITDQKFTLTVTYFE